MKSLVKHIAIIALIFLYLSVPTRTDAQTSVKCGDIIEGEFTQDGDLVYYSISLEPGDSIYITGEVVGDYLSFIIDVFSPDKSNIIASSGINYYPDPIASSDVLSQRGIYEIRLWSNKFGDGVGSYTIYIACTLADGTEILPGDNVVENESPIGSIPLSFGSLCFGENPTTNLSGIGEIPLSFNSSITGVITPNGNEIYGYTLNAQTGNVIEITFDKYSGDLNLGLVVTIQNECIFQVNLFRSRHLEVEIELPLTGEYTINVFKSDASMAYGSEATAFQIRATLN